MIIGDGATRRANPREYIPVPDPFSVGLSLSFSHDITYSSGRGGEGRHFVRPDHFCRSNLNCRLAAVYGGVASRARARSFIAPYFSLCLARSAPILHATTRERRGLFNAVARHRAYLGSFLFRSRRALSAEAAE